MLQPEVLFGIITIRGIVEMRRNAFRYFCIGLFTCFGLSSCGYGGGPDLEECLRKATDQEVAQAESKYFNYIGASPEQLTAFRDSYILRSAEICQSSIVIDYERDSSKIQSLENLESMELTEFPQLGANMNSGKGRFLLFRVPPVSLTEK